MNSLILLNEFVKLFNDNLKVVVDKNYEFRKLYNQDYITFYIVHTLHRDYNPTIWKKENIDKILMDFSGLNDEVQPHQKEIDDIYENIHEILIKFGYLSFQSCLDTYQIVNKHWFRLLKEYDSYGSSLLVDVETKMSFTIFNNYDDSAYINRDKLTLYTPFIIRQDWICEVGDICYNMESQKFYLKNYNTFYFPEALRKIPLDAFTGKSAFYYHPEINTISLKCDNFSITKIPISINHSNGYINLVYDKCLLRKIKIENINI
jgi:hypothetical protein